MGKREGLHYDSEQFTSVQSLICVQLFVSPWIAARQASLSITNSQSLLKLMSIESVMPSKHLIRCRPLLLLSSVFPSIRVFSNESVLHIRWPKDWSSASTLVLPMNTQDWFPLGWTDWISLKSKGLSKVFSNICIPKTNRLIRQRGIQSLQDCNLAHTAQCERLNLTQGTTNPQ